MARLFPAALTVELLNRMHRDSMVGHLGIEFTEIGEDYIRARMPVDRRTVQPFGILHGGASATLVETVGSVASTALIDLERQRAVGLEINANHIRPVDEGHVRATARPIHIGRRTHVWDVRIQDQAGRLVCVGRLTMMILDR